MGHSILLSALLCRIWGSTWLVIKVGYGGLGPFNAAAPRCRVRPARRRVGHPVAAGWRASAMGRRSIRHRS
ncbi:MAG TPA: hypothetical protein VNI78_03935, partial [Vicinamibacterales bacterium]|nr:hypothetical protein [Vicinamibacterales bacterium]